MTKKLSLEEKFFTEMSNFYETLAKKHGFDYKMERLSESCPSTTELLDCPECINEGCKIRDRSYEYDFGGHLTRDDWKTTIGFGFDYESGFTILLNLNFNYLGRFSSTEDESYSSNLKSAREYHPEIGKLLGVEKILSEECEIMDPVLHLSPMMSCSAEENLDNESVFHFGYLLPAKDAKDIGRLDKLLGLVAGYLDNLPEL